MGILRFLFGDKTEIKKEIEDPEFGALVWSEEQEGWKGIYSGMEIILAYEKGLPEPPKELKEYALSVLKDPYFLELALKAAKEKELTEWQGDVYDHEVNALKYSIIHFCRNKSGENYIFAELEPGEDYRAWRIEFREYNCEGLGFDS